MATLAPTARLDTAATTAAPTSRTHADSAAPSRRGDLPWIVTGIGAGAATVAVVGWAGWLLSQIQIPI